MTFEELLTSKLSGIKGLEGKVFPLMVPEDISSPYAVYNQTGGNYIKCLSGSSELMSYTYTVFILAEMYSTLKILEKHVIESINGTAGEFVEKKVQEIIIEAPSEVYEEETRLYRATVEFTAYF